MIASITRSVAPRGARFLTTAARQPTQTAATTTQSASITTTASSIGNPAPTAAQRHIVSDKGSLKSAHRHYHANSSESAAGLSEVTDASAARRNSRMMRMREAKELAGLL